MVNEQSNQNVSSGMPILDTDFEARLLASKLVSEVRRRPDHVSITMTGTGVLEFARAMKQLSLEEIERAQNAEHASLFPGVDASLIPKKQIMTGFKVSHTTLWKWQKSGYLVPVKIGKQVYYKRDDIERLKKKESDI